MATALDRLVNFITARFSAPKGRFPVRHMVFDGRDTPFIANAPENLPALFAQSATQFADTIFIVDGELRLTFAQSYAYAQEVAASLVADYKVQPGDRVAIAAKNSALWIILYMAILMAGGIATLLNGFWLGEELQHAIEDVDARLIFADVPRGARIAALNHQARLVTFDDRLALAQALAQIILTQESRNAPLPTLTGESPATLLFTSGSTGRCKGALSTHRAKVQASYNYFFTTSLLLKILSFSPLHWLGIKKAYPLATLLNLPLFHVTAEVTVLLQSLCLGRKLVLMPKWDVLEAMRLIEKERVTYFTGVPLMSYEILTHANRKDYDLSSCSVFASGGAARPVEHVLRFLHDMPTAKPVAGYGLTETNAVGCANFGSNYKRKPSSAGPATKPLVELAIFNAQDEGLPANQVGEVMIRTLCNITGYWNNAKATQEAFSANGYFRTGDLGYLDQDGYLFIIDRKKDIIVRGGENITSLEVEEALYANAEIAEAYVFALPDARLGEVVGAVVHIHQEMQLEESALKTRLAAHLAAFKVPVKIWFSAEQFPRLGTGKIDKVRMKAHYISLWADAHTA
jgi:long-chain acyl-CoA synthetase